MAFYVFDLDGTIADCEHRRHLLPNFDAFFAACAADEVIVPVRDLLLRLWSGKNRVEIWSGRSDQVRAETEEWLARHGISGSLLTRMRREKDYTPDQDLKRAWLHDEPARPDIVFDDRDKVVAMWRAEGVTCFQVAPGAF